MKGTVGLLVLSCVALALPSRFEAASLGIVASAETIRPGDALSVSVFGDSEGEVGIGFGAMLLFSEGLIPADAVGPFALQTTGGPTGEEFWMIDSDAHGRCQLPEDPPRSCRAADAFFLPFFAAALDLLPSTLTTFEFETSGATPGAILTFRAEPSDVGFFSAGPSELVTVRVVPEPATALLVALGLAFLRSGLRASHPEGSGR